MERDLVFDLGSWPSERDRGGTWILVLILVARRACFWSTFNVFLLAVVTWVEIRKSRSHLSPISIFTHTSRLFWNGRFGFRSFRDLWHIWGFIWQHFLRGPGACLDKEGSKGTLNALRCPPRGSKRNPNMIQLSSKDAEHTTHHWSPRGRTGSPQLSK